MSALTDMNTAFVIEERFAGLKVDSIFALGTRQIQPAGNLYCCLKLRLALLDQFREALQNLIDFTLLNRLSLAQLIVCFDNCHRLDKRRLSRS